MTEGVVQRCSVKNLLLTISQSSQKNTSAGVSFLIKLQASIPQLHKKETSKQVFSCEFREIFKITYFADHMWAVASATTISFPANTYLFEVNNRNTRKGKKYVQS